MVIFWVMSPFSLVGVYQRYVGRYYLHRQDSREDHNMNRNRLPLLLSLEL
jgi:hypothetical protein